MKRKMEDLIKEFEEVRELISFVERARAEISFC